MLLKAVLRILHFLLYIYVHLTTHLKRRVHRIRQGLRYKALWLLNGMPEDDLEILVDFKESRITKVAKHSAIIVNRHSNATPKRQQVERPQDTREESLKVAEIISWMVVTGTTQVTVYDQDGKLRDE